MNNGPLLFFGILATLAASFWGLLLAPQLQIGSQQPVVIETTGQIYPSARSGLAQEGAEVYRAQGCVECHSQQVRQTGVEFDVWLTDAGTNKADVIDAMTQLHPPISPADAATHAEHLPARIVTGLSVADAQIVAKRLVAAGAKAQARLVALGPDIQRGWGKRATVARDYLRDYPVQIGNQRVGPDLANYGVRQTNAVLILQHLYNPQTTMPGSMMPPYRYLFTKRKLNEGENPSLLGQPGYDIVPTAEAEALVAYLLSLNSDVPLFEAPFSMPPTRPVTTNANPATAAPAP